MRPFDGGGANCDLAHLLSAKGLLYHEHELVGQTRGVGRTSCMIQECEAAAVAIDGRSVNHAHCELQWKDCFR